MFISAEEKELTRKLLAKHQEMLDQLVEDMNVLRYRVDIHSKALLGEQPDPAPWGYRTDGKPCAKPGRKSKKESA